MENKPPPLWNESSEKPKPLRPPKMQTAISERLKPSHEGAPPSEINVTKSSLSADAPEFIPAAMLSHNMGGGGGASSVQNRLKKHKTPDFTLTEFVDSPDDNRLKHLILTLTKDPGQFDDLQDIFMETLDPYFEDVVVLSRAAQLLVDQAIDHPSFRYTAARLCCSIEQCCPNFRAELHLTCQKQLQQHANKSGLLMFVAELYVELHHENIYGNYLIEAYKHLLGVGGNDNVKHICQALKLTGRNLEKYNRKAMDEVFAKLNEIAHTVTGTSASLIKSVTNLRMSNWGQTNSDESSNSDSEVPYYGDASNTVFYSADGSKFSNEEAEFLAANMNYTEDFDGYLSDPDELCDPEPEMSEEIQAGFREFVKLTKAKR